MTSPKENREFPSLNRRTFVAGATGAVFAASAVTVTVGDIPAPHPTRTRSSTIGCSRRSATTGRSTKLSKAPLAR